MDIEEIIKDKIAQAEPRWIAQGERNKAVATARNFRMMGVLTIEQIALGTGLSVEEVAAL